jgi:hypothetical protein
MSIPFEEIGPGQKGRHVYQVMGDGGPVPNPKKIRYLPPGDAPSPSPDSIPVGPAGLGGALAISGLFLQAAELGVEIHNAVKLREIESHLQEVLPRLRRIEQSLEVIDQKLNVVIEKIDAVQKMQAEEGLRTDLKFFLEEKHVQEGEVDLERLAKDILETVGRFEDLSDMNVRLGDARGLRLTVETRDYLEEAFRLLHTVRRSAYESANQNVQGDPVQVRKMNLQEDYWPSEIAPHEMVVLTIQGMHWGTKRKVQNRISNQFERIFEEADPVAFRLRPLFYNQVDGHLEEQLYEEFKKWWVWKSDAGLLHRVRKEAKGIAEGYQNVFDIDTDKEALSELESGPMFNLALPNDEEELEELTTSVSASLQDS